MGILGIFGRIFRRLGCMLLIIVISVWIFAYLLLCTMYLLANAYS